MFLQLGLFSFAALVSRLMENCLDRGGKCRLGLHAINVDVAVTIKTAPGGNHPCVWRHIDAEDAPRQRRKLPQQIRIVADHSGRVAMHPVYPRRSVRTAEENLIAKRMSLDALDAAFECARRDGSYVVDESLCRHFNQLGGHIAPDGYKMASVD